MPLLKRYRTGSLCATNIGSTTSISFSLEGGGCGPTHGRGCRAARGTYPMPAAAAPTQSQGGGLCTQRPATIVATTSRVEVVPRVAVEHDEVGGVAREQPAAAALVAREPRRRDASSPRTPAARSAPARDATPRARRSCAARPRGCRRAGRAPRSARPSRSRRRRPSPRATGTRRRRRSCRPRSGRRGRGRTARARTAPTRRRRARRTAADPPGASSCACSIRWRSPSGAQIVARLLERVERLAVRAVADRVHGDRETRPRRARARSPRAPRRS